MKKIFTIIILWLFWGFALGTALLLGPLRSILNESRGRKLNEGSEKWIVIISIIVLAVVSFLIAFYSSKKIHKEVDPAGPALKATLFFIPILLGSVAVYIMMTPKLVNADNMAQEEITTSFTIGPYPDMNRMMELKSQGFTGIITLLHPAIVPFEPKLLGDEKENASIAGLEFISIPFLPWISSNESSVDSMRRLVRTAKGKYYINCYLGKDRVNVVRRIIEQENKSYELSTQSMAARKLDSVAAFERGPITKLEEGVFFTPLPTKEEYFGYIIASNYKQIVALYEKDHQTETKREEIDWLKPYQIPYKEIDLALSISDADMRKLIAEIKMLPKPMVIHSYNSKSSASQRFIQLYTAK